MEGKQDSGTEWAQELRQEGWDFTSAHHAVSTWEGENKLREAGIFTGAKRRFDQAYARIIRGLPWDKGEDQNASGGRLFDYNRISPSVVMGRIPRNREDLECLIDNEGVSAIVSAVEWWEMDAIGLHQTLRASLPLRWLVIPTPDFSSPSLADLVAAVSFSLAGGNGSVYVHCNRGRSRSCIVVLCLLMAQYGLNSARALAHVRRQRPQVTLGPFFSSFWLNLDAYDKGLRRRYAQQVRC